MKKTKARGSHAASYTLFAHLSVRCTCGSSICSHLPPIGGGGGGMKQPYPFLSKSFHAAFVQKRCRSIRAREVPRGMQSCTEPPYTAELRKERGERERDGQRCKRKGKDTRSHPTHSDCHCHMNHPIMDNIPSQPPKKSPCCFHYTNHPNSEAP